MLRLVAAAALLASARAINLSAVFGDHAVLQRTNPLIWGFGAPGVTVTTILPSGKYTTTVDTTGTWRQPLPAAPASTAGFSIAVSGSDGSSQTLNDVMFGDVYACMGEGNIAMTVSSVFNASAEVAAAANYPLIRVFTAPTAASPVPAMTYTSVPQPWAVASPASIGAGNWTAFSATCWFAGKSLFDALSGPGGQSVPLGLLALAYGGSSLQAWLPPAASAGCGTAPAPSGPAPATVFNGMLNPLLVGPLPLAGLIVGQGESNVPPAQRDDDSQAWYACALQAGIATLRAAFNATRLPVAVLQLGAVAGPMWYDAYATLRDAQAAAVTAAAAAAPTQLVVTADLADPLSPYTTFYYRNKQAVGGRVANIMLALAYGWNNVTYASPTVTSAVATSSNTTTVVTVTISFSTGNAALSVTQPACPASIPNSDPNDGWSADTCIGWRVLTGYPKWPAPPTYMAQNPAGFLGAGDDLPGSGMMTVAAAEAACTSNLQCVGFTFASDTPTPSGQVNIYLKSAFNFVQSSGWQSYNSTRKPVGQWYNAVAALGSDGSSVVVTATLPNPGDTAVAVQYGYGPWALMNVWEAASGLPVAPFMVNTTSADLSVQASEEAKTLAAVAVAAGSRGTRRGRRLQPWLGLQPLKWLPLPLGTVQPRGWLAAQLQVQVSGMSGYLHTFYPPVMASPWIANCSAIPGGCQDTNEGEDFAYWFCAAVPMAILTNNTRLLADVTSFVDHILATQDASGWLGPMTDPTDGNSHWARWPVLAALLQWREATGDARIQPAIYAYMKEAYRRLSTAAPLGGDWAGSRWQDFAYVIEWLIDTDPADVNGQKSFLTNFLWLVYGQQTVDWEAWFTPEFFPQGDTGWNYSAHGVNTAQGLKSGAVVYRMTGNPGFAASSSQRLALLDMYHGAPSGVFLADETLASSKPSHATELCAVVESMFSLNVMHEVHGDAAFADRAERVAYNALPGTWSSDQWAHQYLQQPNAVNALHQDAHIWLADGPDATTFGLAPNYPCCTANGPQGWPRYVPRMVHASPDGGLALSLLGPLTATVNGVTLTVDTQYPFDDYLNISVTNAPQAFPLYIRVPGWATAATLSVDGGPAMPVGAYNGTMYQVLLVNAGDHSLVYALNPAIFVDSIAVGFNGAISVHRGPLLYGLHLGEVFNVTAQHNTSSPDHPLCADYEINSTSTWNVALVYDPSDTAGPSKFFSFARTGSLNATQPFDHSNPPLVITAQARELPGWGLVLGSADVPPSSPACAAPSANCGAPQQVTLFPYGMTHLRMSVLPWTPQ